jgi:Xaa-Pro aminopeptidase
VPGRPQGEFLMFCRERNPERELWDGPRAGPDGAIGIYGADDAFPISDLDDILPGLLERSDRVYYSMGATEFDQRLLTFIQTLNSKRQSGHAPRESSRSITCCTRCASSNRLSRASCASPRRSWRARARDARGKPGMMGTVEAEFLHGFAARRGAHPPIVAAGANAPCCTTARTMHSSPTATSCSSTRARAHCTHPT